jgi:lipid-A-disaccharide synthase
MVAGEASGDALGAHLIESLRERLPNVQFTGIGGPRMIEAGLQSWYAQEDLAVRGLVEVARHLPAILRIRRGLLRRLQAEPPNAFIGIDAPDFNLPVERALRGKGVPTVHYVSPTVWGWRRGRLKAIRAAVSHMLVLFPFEEPIYRAAGVPVTFVGHPLADEVPALVNRAAMREQLRLPKQKPVVALLPGSRVGEIELMARPFIEAAGRILAKKPDVQFVAPFVTRESRQAFERVLYELGARKLPLSMLFGHAHDALASADVVLVASGTATLEAALFKRAMVVAYRLSPFTAWLLRRMVRVKAVALPNLLLGEFVVPEFLQEEADGENLAQAVLNLLDDADLRAKLAVRFDLLHQILRRDAARRAAEAVIGLMSAAASPAGMPAAGVPAARIPGAGS